MTDKVGRKNESSIIDEERIEQGLRTDMVKRLRVYRLSINILGMDRIKNVERLEYGLRTDRAWIKGG